MRCALCVPASVLVAALLTSCQTSVPVPPSPTPSLSPSSVSTPTWTPTPTVEPSPTPPPTLTPTAIPSPTPMPSLTSTPLPIPTRPPIPTATLVPSPAPTSTATPLPAPTATFTPSPTSTPSIGDVVQKATHSVVYVFTATGSGSGFVTARGNQVLTSAYLVGRDDAPTIITEDGSSYRAQVIGLDEYTDLALLQVPVSLPAHIPFGASANIRVGDDVIVLGYPEGPFTGWKSVIRGIVTGLGVTSGTRYIQTDASISRGNIGGPVLDRYGNLIGLIAFSVADTQGFRLGIHLATIETTLPSLELGRIARASPGPVLTPTPMSIITPTPTPTRIPIPTPTPQIPALASWSHPYGDATNTQSNWDEKTLQPPVSVKWSANVGKCLTQAPLVDGGAIYALALPTDDKGTCTSPAVTIQAHDAVTGQLRWEYPTRCSLAPRVVALRQTLYLYCPDTDLSSGAQPTYSIRALSSVQPQQLWAFDTAGYSGQFMISNGDVLFVETYGKVMAVDAVSGKALWEYSTAVGSFATAAATRDVLYLYSTTGVVEALDIATQKQLWRVKVDPVASPALAIDTFRLLLLSRRQITSVLATDSGAMYRALPVGTQSSPNADTVAAGTYYGQVKGLVSDSIVAIDIGPTMPKRWEALTPMFNDRRVTVSSFAYANAYIWMGSGPAGLHAYEASTGRLIASIQVVGEANAIMYVVPANGMLFAGTKQGKLYAYGKP